jgi:hypothetical protein
MQKRHRSRSASYPTAPAQIPACGIIAPGSSEILASRSSLSHRRCCARPWPLHDPRSFDLELLQEFIEAFPVVALPLAALIELSPQHPHSVAEELVQSDGVSMNAVVIVIATQLGA